MSTPQPGWYDDPTAPGRLRWWDGQRWTEQTRVIPIASEPEPPVSRPGPAAAIPLPESSPSRPLFEAAVSQAAHVPPPPPPPAAPPAPPAPPASGSSRRRGVVVGVAIALAVVGAGLAMAIGTTTSGNVFDLAVGSCFDDDAAALESAEVRQIDDVPISECSGPHHNEVFDAFDVDLVEFPGSTSLADMAVEECTQRFPATVGFPVEMTNLEVSALWPTETSWASGDREVLCILYALDGSYLRASTQGIAGGVRAAVFELQAADCFDAPLLDPAPEVEVAAVKVVDCNVPHFAEVYQVISLDQEVTYPGRSAIMGIAQDRCLDAFEPYAGESWESSSLYFNALPPTDTSWEIGDRDIFCFVYDPDNGTMVGDARDWAHANRGGEGFEPDYDVSHLRVGDCFDDDFDEGEFPAISCDGPHDNEVFAVFQLPDGDWLGADEVLAKVAEVCDPAYEEWTGGATADLSWFSFQPSEGNWADGQRDAVCALYSQDLEPLVVSQRRQPV